MQNVLKMNIDFKIKNYFNVIAQQNDDLIIIANVFDNGVPANLNGCSVIVNYVNANNTIANIAGGNISFKDNLITIACPRDCTRSYGTANMQITIVSSNKQVSSFPIGVKVNAGVIQGQEVSKNVVTITEELNNASVEALKAKTGVVDATKVAKSNMEEVQKTYVGATELARKVEQHSSQLEKINSNYIENRPFKPKFGYNCYWSSTVNGTVTHKTKIDIKNDIDKLNKNGIDEITMVLKINWNASEKKIFCIDNLDNCDWAINYCKDKNVKIKTIKMHEEITAEQMNSITFAKYDEQYRTILQELSSHFKDKGIEIFTVLNEFMSIDQKEENANALIAWMKIVQDNGFKSGITTSGIYNNTLVPESVIAASDVICANVYPAISFKLDKTTKQDSVNAWSHNEVFKWIKHRKAQYPDKEIIISETGVPNFWEYLGGDATSMTNLHRSNKATEVFLYGLFEVLKDIDGLSRVWWWYGFWVGGTDIEKIFNQMLKGE